MYAYRCIVLSGNPGAGKSALATALSKEYGWPIYSIGRLWREKYKKEHPEGDISFEEFWSRTSKKENLEVNVQAKAIFESGNVIGELRYTANLDKSICLLVFVTADIATRVKRAVGREEYKGMSKQQITETLVRRERDEVARARDLFGNDYDYRDPKNYHVVVDSDKLTVAQEVGVINTLMKN
jgi:cytidylate kinase